MKARQTEDDKRGRVPADAPPLPPVCDVCGRRGYLTLSELPHDWHPCLVWACQSCQYEHLRRMQ